MSEYIVRKNMKYDGKTYNPGDPITLNGAWDDKLIGSYVERVDAGKDEDTEKAKRMRYQKRQKSLQPGKNEEIEYDISSAAQKLINANGLDPAKIAQAAGTARITQPVVQQYIREE